MSERSQDHYSSKKIVKRGDVFFADLSPVVGSEQGGVRPVLIIQNDIGNRFSPTVIVAAITAQIKKAKLPTHVEIDAEKHRFDRDSVILLEQLRTIDKQRLTDNYSSGRRNDGACQRRPGNKPWH